MLNVSYPTIPIAVCDDEPQDLSQIVSMAKEVLEADEISCDIFEYEDAASLLSAIHQGGKFQILLLDIMMEGLDGMELATVLRSQENHSAIIFISNNRDMAMQGYEVAATRYLSKPLKMEKLQEALLFCCRVQLEQKEILLPTAAGQRRIVLSDIIYAEPWNRGSRLILLDGECQVTVKISNLADILPKRKFAFCHRTLLVNLAFVQSIRYRELTLKTGESLPVSKYRQTELKEKFLDYLRN